MNNSEKIAKLKKALKSPTTPEALKGQLQMQIDELEAEDKSNMDKGILPHPKSKKPNLNKPKEGDFVKVSIGYGKFAYGKITKDYSDETFYVGDQNGYEVTGIGDRLKPNQFEVITETQYKKGILPHPKSKKPTVSRSVKSVAKKYYSNREIKSITVLENGNKVIYKASDLLDGATFLEKGGDTGKTIDLYPLQLIPLSNQLQKITGDSLNTSDYFAEDGSEYSTIPNKIIVHKSSGKKFKMPMPIYTYVDGYNLVHNIFQNKITVYETGDLIAEIKDGKLDFTNKDNSVTIDRNKVRNAFEKGFIPDSENANNFYKEIEQKLFSQYSMYEDVEDNPNSSEAKAIQAKIKELEDLQHRLERKYEKGGKLSDISNYVAVRNIVEIELVDGTKTKPANGYHIKKGAKPFMENGGKTEEGIDLFEDYEQIPPEVQEILDRHSQAFEDGDYEGLKAAWDEVNAIGYTFEYYLDGQAYDLRKIGQKGKVEAAEEFEDGGKIEVFDYKSKYEKNKIKSVADVEAFFKYLHNTEKLVFHPDDEFYGNMSDHITKKQAINLDRYMLDCFDVCEKEKKDIYGIAANPMFLASNDKTFKNLSVEISAEPNPDYDKNTHNGSINIKPKKVKINSLQEASTIVRKFINDNDLGGGNFTGGNIYSDNKIVGRVSYNGRIWDVNNNEMFAKGGWTKDHKYVNKSEDYETRYAKGKNRLEYKEKGGEFFGRKAKGFSVSEIAKMHNVSLSYLKKQLEKGQKVELEHTTSESVAYAIAKDHLYENPDYYILLKVVEIKSKGGEVGQKIRYKIINETTRSTLSKPKANLKTSKEEFQELADSFKGFGNKDVLNLIKFDDNNPTDRGTIIMSTFTENDDKIEKKYIIQFKNKIGKMSSESIIAKSKESAEEKLLEKYPKSRIITTSERDIINYEIGGEVSSKEKTSNRGSKMFDLAKEIRQPGEKWLDAVKRASTQLKNK